ncbi:MAG: U32 family peptidase [SAR324 cluster bacterium]|nr:U32 family peptidase [SAR324 cluster bacterium]
MNYSLNLSRLEDTLELKSFVGQCILLQSRDFSKFGQITLEELPEIAKKLQPSKCLNILDFSILVKDQELQSKLKQLTPYLELFDRIRCADPGVALTLAKLNKIDLEFSLEQAAPNGEAALAWVERLGGRLKKLVLSNQFPIPEITKLREKIDQKIEFELLALGPVETFYSRRKLISRPMKIAEDEISTTAFSDDRPTQVGRLIQNSHGTFYFHDKDLCLIGLEEAAKAAGVNWFRLELQSPEEYQLLSEYFNDNKLQPEIAEAWPQKTTVGFFYKNRTDKPLKRLTNNNLQEKANFAVGRVIEAKKKVYMVLEILKEITQPFDAVIVNPEGKEATFCLNKATHLNGDQVGPHLTQGIYLFKWVKYASAMSLILPSHD